MTTSFQATNGLLVTIRPLGPDDAPHLYELFDHLSVESRYRRFHLALEHADPAWLRVTAEQILDLHPPSQGWLAFADLPGQPSVCIGGARLIVTSPDVAETSLTVRDDLQGYGIGAELLRLIVEAARQAGVQRLIADAQASNLPVFRLLKRLGLRYRSETHAGETHLEVDLTQETSDTAAASAGSDAAAAV